MKRRMKVARYKTKKAKEEAAASQKRFINPRDVKGVRGVELREATLGQEYSRRGKTGGIIDKREGGDTADEGQMLARMQKVRERKADRYKLGDDGGGLTHYGTSLGEVLPTSEPQEPTEKGEHRKGKEEIFDEIIEKSRAYRDEKRVANEERNAELQQLDKEWRDISSLVKLRSSEKKPVPSTAPLPKRAGGGRVLVLGKDGSAHLEKAEEPKGKEVPAERRAEMQAILEKVRKETAKEREKEAEAQEAAGEVLDEYDTFMMQLENSTVAKGGQRTKSAAEVAAEAQAELLRLHREKTRRMRQDGVVDDEEVDELKIAAQLAPRQGDTDEVRESKARKQASALFEGFLTELEQECSPPTEDAGHEDSYLIDFTRVDSIVQQLRTLSKVSPVAACMTARGIVDVLQEMLQREIAGKLVATPFALLACSAFARIFPGSDFRHPVSTPLALLLASSVFQSPLTSLRAVAASTFRAAVLLDFLQDSRRYCGELLAFLANALSLFYASPQDTTTKAIQRHAQAQTTSAMEGMKRKREQTEGGGDGDGDGDTEGTDDFLVAERRSNTVLSSVLPEIPTHAAGGFPAPMDPSFSFASLGSAGRVAFCHVFCSQNANLDTPRMRHDLLCAIYSLLKRCVDTFRPGSVPEDDTSDTTDTATAADHISPALEPLLHTLDTCAERAQHYPTWLRCKSVEELHNAVTAAVRAAVDDSINNRVPLRLQAHRPIPLPLYHCKITEFEEGEQDERRAIKKELRAERKKVIKEIRADSRFLSRQREQEREGEMQQREDKLKTVMTELQQQRKLIKDSDVAKGKLKAMQKKAKS